MDRAESPSAPNSTDDDRHAADEHRLVDEAVELARGLLVASDAGMSRSERRRRDRLGRLLDDPAGRELVLALTDEVLRIDRPVRAARRFAGIVHEHPTSAVGTIDRLMLRAGALIAPRLPRIVMPLVTRRITAETRGIVLSAADPAFAKHIEHRRTEGVRLNVNPLGEAILSDFEAAERLALVRQRINRTDVDYVSVKISAVVANLDVLAFEQSIERISERLRVLFRDAMNATPRTFLNLDMEEYRDLELSLVAFMQVLDEPEFEAIDAGIVLQAYLPDSHEALDRLGAWAAERHRRAGGHVKVRIVKGANLAMEAVEAELHNWIPAPYPTKADVDASFKAMLDSALRAEWADSLRIGLASHNLFDIAWALVITRERDALDRVEFEMLEGMAPSQARAVLEQAGALLMYAPVVAREDFDASIAYLSRRLDENTQPENFLRALFTLVPDTPQWHDEERRFRTAVAARHTVERSRRRGSRTQQGDGFANIADSDMTDPDVRTAIRSAALPKIHLVRSESTFDIDRAVARASGALSAWSVTSTAHRRALIGRVAATMADERFTALALMADETGKTAHEADPEISEAIDFATYYSGPGIELLDSLRSDGLAVDARGVVTVIGPWNFPYAIPAGGVFAALAAGNAVILKPAPEAERVAALLVDQIHRAGVPTDLVQLVVCEDGPVGQHLVTHADVDTVILTGSFATAELFLGWRPDLRLYAETSGKNSLIITAAADLDLAINDLVRSAFGHAGQKCSAASLGIVEASLYDDPEFSGRLRHVVDSMRVGWPDDLSTMVGPVILPPTGPLRRALTSLDPGEEWLVEPRQLDESGRLWSPGIRLGVRRGSWFHRTECFGPVLGIMRAADLADAIAIQNDSAFGLTGGLHSLDPGEIEQWLAQVEVGNAYVNRHITGAVVRRQPFGGWKQSSVGPGSKAGGPSYLLQFCRIGDEDTASTAGSVEGVAASYEHAWSEHFTTPTDPSGLRSEANILRYRPVERVVVRHAGSVERLRTAARVTGVEFVESDSRADSVGTFLASLRSIDRVRLVDHVEPEVLAHCHANRIWVDTAEPSRHGRVELTKWVREQAISHTLHRHGRLAST